MSGDERSYATVQLRIPRPSSMLVVNLLGTLGLLGLAIAVGGLTHNFWWSLLVASFEAVAVALVLTTNMGDADEQADVESPGRALRSTA